MYNNFTQNEWKTNLNYKNLQFSLFKKSRVWVVPHTGAPVDTASRLSPTLITKRIRDWDNEGVKDKGKS